MDYTYFEEKRMTKAIFWVPPNIILKFSKEAF
jgi:hypothetical protein